MSKLNQEGFTLIEILIYTVIFAIVGGMLTGILINATRVEQRESASSEVTSQLNFVMQTIGRLVRESSNIEIEAGTTTSTLKLRMRDSAKDPTYITLVSNAIKLQEGSSATTTLTSDKVTVNNLSFKKFTQYPGHDTVSIDLTLTYNTQNTAGQVERTLSSAIARVSAATFDADVLPGGTYNYNLGQTGSPWQKIIMADGSAANPSYTFGSDTGLGIFRAGSNALGFTSGGTERMRISGGAIGIGTTTPNNALVVAGNGRLTVTHANEPSLLLQIDGVSKAMIGVGPGIITGIGNNDLGIRSDGSSITLGIGNQRQITLNTSSTAPLVGIGTTTPASTLTVAGTIESTSGGFKFPDATTQISAATGGGLEGFGFEYVSASQAKITRTGRTSGGSAAVRVDIAGTMREKTDADLTLDITTDLESGQAEAASTWYYAYLYWSGSAIVGKLSTTTPSSAGYHPTQTNWRYVGEVRNDGSSNFEYFLRFGKTVFRIVSNLVANGYSGTFTTVDASSFAPRTSRIILATASSRQGTTNATGQRVEIRPAADTGIAYYLLDIIDSGNTGSSGDEFSGDGVQIALDSLQRFDWQRTGGNSAVVFWRLNAYAYVITTGN